MKLLLDENLPHALRNELPGHDCYTVAFMGWSGIVNGRLLGLAADAGFDAVLTRDGNLPNEQNLKNLPLAVIVLHAYRHKIDHVRPVIPKLLELLKALPPNQISHVG